MSGEGAGSGSVQDGTSAHVGPVVAGTRRKWNIRLWRPRRGGSSSKYERRVGPTHAFEDGTSASGASKDLKSGAGRVIPRDRYRAHAEPPVIPRSREGSKAPAHHPVPSSSTTPLTPPQFRPREAPHEVRPILGWTTRPKKRRVGFRSPCRRSAEAGAPSKGLKSGTGRGHSSWPPTARPPPPSIIQTPPNQHPTQPLSPTL